MQFAKDFLNQQKKSRLSTKHHSLILQLLPAKRNPPDTQIVTLTKILTPFLASRKCHYYEWGPGVKNFGYRWVTGTEKMSEVGYR